jgi:hypothetical protein
MGITMRQQIAGIANAYEAREREIEALQRALLGMIMDENSCHIACKEHQNHPAPWHAEKCGCACEARAAYRAQIELPKE